MKTVVPEDDNMYFIMPTSAVKMYFIMLISARHNV